MQLAARIRARDLEDFFSAVGKVSSFADVVLKRTKKVYFIFILIEWLVLGR